MKTAEKNTTSSLQRSSLQQPGRPFLQKNGADTFFSENTYLKRSPFGGAENTVPFFSPSNIQAKLTIGQPGDPYEQEADRTAEKVVEQIQTNRFNQENAPSVQSKSLAPSAPAPATAVKRENPTSLKLRRTEEEEEPEKIQPEIRKMAGWDAPPVAPPDEGSQGNPSLQLKCAACESAAKEDEETPDIRKKSIPGAGEQTASSDLESRLNTTKGGGAPLPEETRSSMESAMGADFSGVRVHTNSGAVQMNRELGAQAFTHGSDIYFNSGKYDPQSRVGQGLLAHELVHTVQQSHGNFRKIARTLEEQLFSANLELKTAIEHFIGFADLLERRGFLDWVSGEITHSIDLSRMDSATTGGTVDYLVIHAVFDRIIEYLDEAGSRGVNTPFSNYSPFREIIRQVDDLTYYLSRLNQLQPDSRSQEIEIHLGVLQNWMRMILEGMQPKAVALYLPRSGNRDREFGRQKTRYCGTYSCEAEMPLEGAINLSGLENIDYLAVLTHGTATSIKIGHPNSWMQSGSFAAAVRQHLAPGATIILYACSAGATFADLSDLCESVLGNARRTGKFVVPSSNMRRYRRAVSQFQLLLRDEIPDTNANANRLIQQIVATASTGGPEIRRICLSCRRQKPVLLERGGFASQVSSALSDLYITVWGHFTVGHTTRNPDLRVHRPTGSSRLSGIPAGQPAMEAPMNF